MQTYPVSLSFLRDDYETVFGGRLQKLVSEPFDVDTLKRRVLQKTKAGDKAKPAYYIDARDLDHRLNLVFGPLGWTNEITIKDMGDRVTGEASLSICGMHHSDISEELKMRGSRANDLAAMNAGAAAQKRAAVKFGIGAYLYNFKDHVTWDPIDNWGNFTDKITIAKLPQFARPTPDAQLVVNELKYLFMTEDVEDLKKLLQEFWGISTFDGVSRDDCFRLSACIARISDYCEKWGLFTSRDPNERAQLVGKLRVAKMGQMLQRDENISIPEPDLPSPA